MTMNESRVPSAEPFGAFVRKPARRAGVAHTQQSGSLPAEVVPEAVSSSDEADSFIEVGAVGGAYGLQGWVKVYPYAQAGNGSGALLKAKRWRLTKESEVKVLAVREAKQHGGSNIAAHLSGCSDRDQAEALKGWRIWVSRADFPTLSAGEYYWVDLIGLEAVNDDGTSLGKVVGLLENSAHAILRIAYEKQEKTGNKAGMPSNDERLVPFVDAHVGEVDFTKRQIVVHWEEEI